MFGVSLQEYMIYWIGLIVIGIVSVVYAIVISVVSLIKRRRN